MVGELWHGQAQNVVNLEFQVKLHPEGQGHPPPPPPIPPLPAPTPQKKKPIVTIVKLF